MRQVIGREAVALVFHGHRDAIAVAVESDVNRLTRRAVLAGVVQQVVEQLAEQGRVDPDP